MNAQKPTLSIRLTPEVNDMLGWLVAHEDRTKTKIIERLIRAAWMTTPAARRLEREAP